MGLEGDILFLEIVFFVWGEQRSCDGRRGAQRPVGRGKEPQTTGARSARARMRGQNPLVLYVLVIKLTEERRRRVLRGRDTDGEIGDGEIEEGGRE